MNIKNVFHIDYWFGQPFSAQGATLWILLGLCFALILTGLICKILAQFQEDKFKKITLKRFGTVGLTMGFVALLLMFFRQEGIRFFAWRFWLFLWVVGLVWWVSVIVCYMCKRVPNIKQEEDRRVRIEKYLPKSK